MWIRRRRLLRRPSRAAFFRYLLQRFPVAKVVKTFVCVVGRTETLDEFRYDVETTETLDEFLYEVFLDNAVSVLRCYLQASG